MLTILSSLRVLFIGYKKPENEFIRQKLSDGLHCSVFFDSAAHFSNYAKLRDAHRYDILLADYSPSYFSAPIFIRSTVMSGTPIIYLFDKYDSDAMSALIAEGAAGCIMKNDTDRLVEAVYEIISNPFSPVFKDHGYYSNDNSYVADEILENLDDPFYIVDQEWRLKFINRSAEKCWGCPREDLLGRDFWGCFSHLNNSTERKNHETAMKERIPMQWESSSSDLKNWAEIRVYPIQDGGLAVFFRGITDKKRAEEVLRLSRDRQSVMLQLSDSLRLLNNPGDIHEAAASIVGEYLGVEKAFYCDVVTVGGVEYFLLDKLYSVKENNIFPGLHPITSPGVLARENYEGRNIVVCDMETDPRIGNDIRPSLRECRLGAWISVPLIRNGRFVAGFTVHQRLPRNWTQEEISLIEETTARTWAEVDRVRAEAALRKSEQHALQLVSELENAARNKNEFINTLSHELRNPLAAITANLSMLDILDSNPDTKKAKNIIKRQSEQLCHLVDDLLDLTRITNNKIQLNRELVDLNELARSAAYDHRTLFDEKEITLVTEIGDQPLYINADPVRVSQVIGNLLHNASKFTGNGGNTQLGIYKEGNDAVIVVKDSGIGISPSFLPELFKTFRQSEPNNSGLGLGLSIIKGIVERHEGTVNAQSEGLGHGTTFTVRLPLPTNPDVKEAAVMKDEEHIMPPLKILLIDDNQDLAETTGSLLTLYGYSVRTAYTGINGIQTAKEFLPHVIICDIGLPDIDGYEVARRISGCRELAGVSLISLSGYAQTGDFEFSKNAGFAMHISKPLDFDSLRKHLDSIGLKQSNTGYDKQTRI